MNPPFLRQTRSKGSDNLILLSNSPGSKKSKKSDSSPSTIAKNGIINSIRNSKKKESENASKRLNCKIDQMQLARSAKLPQPPRRSPRINSKGNKPPSNPYRHPQRTYPQSDDESTINEVHDDGSKSTTVSQQQKQVEDAAEAARKMLISAAGGGGGKGNHPATIEEIGRAHV